MTVTAKAPRAAPPITPGRQIEVPSPPQPPATTVPSLPYSPTTKWTIKAAKRLCEVELWRKDEGDTSLLLSPSLSCRNCPQRRLHLCYASRPHYAYLSYHIAWDANSAAEVRQVTFRTSPHEAAWLLGPLLHVHEPYAPEPPLNELPSMSSPLAPLPMSTYNLPSALEHRQ
jgi:hypothetical protein